MHGYGSPVERKNPVATGIDLAGWQALVLPLGPDTPQIVADFQTKYLVPPFACVPTTPHHDTVFAACSTIVPHDTDLSGFPEIVQQAWPDFHHQWSLAYTYRGIPWLEKYPYLTYGFSWDVPGQPGVQFHALIIGECAEHSHISVWGYCLNLATWWHLERGGVMLHASAIARTPQDAYVFLGRSGAGKTTVSRLSAAAGHTVIADDLIFAVGNGANGHRLAALPSPNLSPAGYSPLRPPLRAIFQLVQDDGDFLQPMAQHHTARMLFESMMQTPSVSLLPPDKLGESFLVVAQMARTLPAYELHFRESSDFWNVIDAEFGHG